MIPSIPVSSSSTQKLKFKQKISLLFFSFLTTLVILEIILRVGGILFNFRQEWGNRTNFESGEFRILCIGESTTALGGENAYPYQLAEILRTERPQLNI